MSAMTSVKNCVSEGAFTGCYSLWPAIGAGDGAFDLGNKRAQAESVDTLTLLKSHTNNCPLTPPPPLILLTPKHTFGLPTWQGGTQAKKKRWLTKKQFVSAFRAIGDGIMAVVNGIASILTGLVNAVVEVCRVIVKCLTCGKVRR